MITSSSPESWRALQAETAKVLHECGFSVAVEKCVETVRGSAELDVYAEETIDCRRYSIVCECKHWRARVPQAVIHGFRTIVADMGANIGLIVASNGFQSGATPAATFTNVRLVTWEEFQAEFEQTWLKQYLQHTVAERCGPLLTFTEPLLPAWFRALSDEQQDAFVELKRAHEEFGWLMMRFTPYVRTLRAEPFPELPLRPCVAQSPEAEPIPSAILDARGYREFLDAALTHSDRIIEQFRAFRPVGEP